MKLIYQIPRNSLIWLLLAQWVVILPHVSHLPAGLLVGGLIVLLWRIQVYRGVWRFPGNLLKLLLVLLSAVSLKLGYGRLFGLEPMIALLIAAFLLKSLEMHSRRDALVVIYLGFFTAATQFLISQTILSTFYGFLSLLLLTTALLGINQSQGHRHIRHSLSSAGRLLLQSLPLMLLLFFVMPRIGALWTVPLQRHAAQTGVSDSMAPGDFTRLSRAGGLAFRASFDGPIPSADKLYWRGLVFSRFDGRRWSQAETYDYRDRPVIQWREMPAADWRQLVEPLGSEVDYSVILESTQQPWLYALSVPLSIPADAGLVRDFRLLARKPVRQRREYRVRSALDFRLASQGLPPWQRELELKLPVGLNPQTRKVAAQWRRQASSDEELINRVLSLYQREFTYTLEPPGLGRHSVDEFLWQTKRGFCEHFASSFVFFMRAAGIPARVVVGYQGGERSPLDDYLLVYQYDAHAWSEVWLPGRGWTRVDPTAAVAPSRIERGINDALDERESRLIGGALSLERYRYITLLNQLRLRWDVLNYSWHRWVLGYDAQSQSAFLHRWLGGVDPWRIALLLVGGGGAVLGAITLWLWWRGRRRLDPQTRLYSRFLRCLARRGLERQRGEAPRMFAARAAKQRPELKATVDEITRLYERAAYADDQSALAELRSQVNRFWWRGRLLR